MEMHVNTVDRIRKRFVLEGEAPALNRKVRQTPAVPPKIDGVIEAHLIAICTGPAPEGRARSGPIRFPDGRRPGPLR